MVVTVAAVLAGGGLWRSGVVLPQLRSADSYGWSIDPQARYVDFSIDLRNDGWTPIEVLGAGRDGPGLDLIETRGKFPTALDAGDRMQLVIAYRLTDCAAVPTGPWPLPVRVGRPWGTYTVDVNLPSQLSLNGGLYPWQKALAHGACGS